LVGADEVAVVELPLELELAIRNAPDDREGYSVAADWLQQHGSPQGELVALSLVERNDDIIDRLIELKHELLPAEFRKLSPTSIEWRWGFVRGVHLSSVDDPSEPRMLRDLLASPIARFVQKLVINHAKARILDGLFEAIAAEPRALRCLRTFILHETASLRVFDVSRLSALRSIRRLGLHMQKTSGALALPHVHELTLWSHTHASHLIATSELPALEVLHIQGRSAIDLRKPNRWLSPQRLPSLRSLSFTSEEELDARVWRESAIAPQLEQLVVVLVGRGQPMQRQFVIDRRPRSEHAALFVVVGHDAHRPGELIPIAPGFRIGRLKTSNLFLDDHEIGPRHCELVRIGNEWRIRAVDQLNYVYVNGDSTQAAELRHDDEIALGGFVFRFIEDDNFEDVAVQMRLRYGL
jgi:uncharacterized protein (TIGR02996 family)